MIALTVQTAHPNFESLVEEFSQRCDAHYVVLDVAESVPVGDRASFEIYLEDGALVFQGTGECVETMEHEDDVDPAFRHRVVLGSLELDDESRVALHRFLQAAGISASMPPPAAAEVEDVGDVVMSIRPGPASDAPMPVDDFATSLVAVPEAAAVPSVSLPPLQDESTSLASDDQWESSTTVAAEEPSAAVPAEREPSLPPPLPSARVSAPPAEPSFASVPPAATVPASIPPAEPAFASVPPAAAAPASIPPASIPPASIPPAFTSEPPRMSAPPARSSFAPEPAAAEAFDVEPVMTASAEQAPIEAPPRRHVSVAPAPPRPATGLRRPSVEPSWEPIAEAPVSSGSSSGLFAYGLEGLPRQSKAPRPDSSSRLVPASALVGDPADWATSEIDISQI